MQYLGLAQAGTGSGCGRWWRGGRRRCSCSSRAVAAGRTVPAAAAVWASAVAIGAGAALALLLYLWAAQRQMVSVVVVLASLYPAVPTVLGLTLLHERVNFRQTAGLVGAVIAILLLTLG
ncbi:EamA family transporter [Streptomyces sp. MNU76]|uniref:EamA family transporter n=1 Tax=Streptomyces sp. MNU76 TaxID=2560026 RepID=UPI001E2A8369|nr:EamA family transporter [Streptomyces sp. MNU76]MCC9711021.1 EamA family transporter [Streptomyces sp. MNU76]